MERREKEIRLAKQDELRVNLGDGAIFSDRVQRIRTSLPPAKASSCLNINIACNDNCLGFSLASVKELCEFSPTSVNELSSLLKTVFEVMRFRPDSGHLD